MDTSKKLSPKFRKRRFPNFFLTASFALFLLFGFVSSSVLFGILSILIRVSSLKPISTPSHCKIISSSVDIKLSKVCDLGLLNYKAKHIFYPFEKKKFRCWYDYYWASVFKVEFKDYSSGEMRMALVEAPNEALPHACRPDFGLAWLTKDKFKVNETYECGYTPGMYRMSMYQDNLFSCRAKDPSPMEMFRRYSILVTEKAKEWSKEDWCLKMMGGVVSGLLTSFAAIALVMFLR